MPPSAASTRPARDSSAPVKAPFSWPKSSLAMSDGESVAQSTVTQGPSDRRERS